MNEDISTGLSFDDVFLLPRRTDVIPEEVDLNTRLTPDIPLPIPLISAAMDTVTEDAMARSMARQGGIGVIHRNCSIERQQDMIRRVKRADNMVIEDPVTASPETPIREAKETMRRERISGMPVVDDTRRVLGMVTRRDFRFADSDGAPISNIMIEREQVITVPPDTSLDRARAILHRHRIEKLPLVDEGNRLVGMITGKDIEKRTRHERASHDGRGRLRVAGAIGVSEGSVFRAEALAGAGVDVLVIDAATGHTTTVRDVIRRVKGAIPAMPVIAGNIATRQGAEDLIEWGADAIKVGLGPGSICTTRMVSGVGVPQFTAIRNAAPVGRKHGIPVIADGGVRYPGDVIKALAAGADTVMAGSLFAGTEESPGHTLQWKGKTFKQYRGMGSKSAMEAGSADRYNQNGSGPSVKTTPEGVESRVPYKGPVSEVIEQYLGGVRSGMGYVGARSLKQLREQARFTRVTSGGLRESHPHDVVLTEDPVSYSVPSPT